MTKLIEFGWGGENPAFRQMFALLFMPDGTAEEIDSFNHLQQVSASPESASRIVRSFADIEVEDEATGSAAPR